jgi:hypothetical protein
VVLVVRAWFAVAGLSALIALGGCQGDALGINLTLQFSDDVTDEMIAQVTSFDFTSDGDETFDGSVALDRPAQRVERTLYRPSTQARQLTITVRALDASNTVLASGQTDSIALTPGHTAAATAFLEVAAMSSNDLSVPIDAAAPDLAGVDLVSYDGGPIYCPPNALICDGFESGDTSHWTDVQVGAPATLAVDSVMPFRGTYALDGHMPVNASPQPAYVEYQFSSSAEVVAARAYVLAPTAIGNYSAILSFRQGSKYFSVDTDQSNRWTISEQGVDHPSGIGMPLNKWVCVELVVDYSGGGNGHVRLYANSTLMVDFIPASARMPFTTMQVGMVRGAGNVDGRIYVDEVALAPGMIGCQ